jgi:hypothetical protein
MDRSVHKNIFIRSVWIGVTCCVFGTVLLFGTFELLLRGAERWVGTRMPNDTLMGMFHQNWFTACFAVGGVAFAWFAFGFFIAYSRMSSRAELGE